MNRRDLIQLLAAAPALPAGSKPRFFTPAEYEAIEDLSDRILPGARKARAAFCIDLLLAHGDETRRKEWKDGLAALAGRGYFASPGAVRESILKEIAQAELNPRSTLERFFLHVKRMTMEAFILSEEGRAGFGFRNHPIYPDFPGCGHSHEPSA